MTNRHERHKTMPVVPSENYSIIIMFSHFCMMNKPSALLLYFKSDKYNNNNNIINSLLQTNVHIHVKKKYIYNTE